MPLSRWSKRHEKTFGKKKEKRNGNFRLPPKPDCYYTKVKGQWVEYDVKTNLWHGCQFLV